MKKRILTVLLILTMIFVSGCDATAKVEPAEVEEKVSVSVAKAEVRDMSDMLVIGGLLNPQQEITLVGGGSGATVDKLNFQVGDPVKKGDRIISMDLNEIDTQIKTLEMNKRSLEDGLALQKELLTIGAVSEQDVKSMEDQLSQLKMSLNAAYEGRKLMACESTIDGIVSYLPVTEGQLVASSTVCAQVVNIDKLLLTGSVSESYIGGIHIGDEIEVTIPSTGEVAKGRVKSVPPTVNVQTKSYLVTVEIDNPEHKILGGMYGEMTLSLGSNVNALAIPQKAIINNGDGDIVFVIDGDKAVERKVTVGTKLGEYAEIISGVKEGEKVVVSGMYTCYDGATVNIVSEG